MVEERLAAGGGEVVCAERGGVPVLEEGERGGEARALDGGGRVGELGDEALDVGQLARERVAVPVSAHQHELVDGAVVGQVGLDALYGGGDMVRGEVAQVVVQRLLGLGRRPLDHDAGADQGKQREQDAGKREHLSGSQAGSLCRFINDRVRYIGGHHSTWRSLETHISMCTSRSRHAIRPWQGSRLKITQRVSQAYPRAQASQHA